jgi:hypothetical protein
MDKLEKQEQWDFEHPERRRGRRKGRIVVSVAFPRDDFNTVAVQAEKAGKPVSTFIRDAVLGRVDTHTLGSTFTVTRDISLVLSADIALAMDKALGIVTQAPEADFWTDLKPDTDIEMANL